VPEEVILPDEVEVYVGVPDKVPVPDEEAVLVRVIDGVGGATVPLADAASLPTVMSTPHASGRVSVAEYTHVGFSFTPLMLIVAPHARARRNVRLQLGDTGASGP
jgi:hypothetical protein